MNGLAFIDSLAQWRGTKDFNLDSISAVLNHLGNPQDKPRSVHVAGTNGKGSVVAAVASILGQAGYRVGATISPHLYHFSERILIDGVPAALESVNEAALRVKEAAQAVNVQLSYHEGLTAVAFECFKYLDWIVVEVGLGGRLDSTNTLHRPDCCIVTSVDFDHQEILGDSLEAIATEKAGIVKPGAVVVAGKMEPVASEVIRAVAAQYGAEVFVYGEQFAINFEELARPGTFAYDSEAFGRCFLRPPVEAASSAANMAVACTAGQALGIDLPTCLRGIESYFWPGRLEEVQLDQRLMLIDCAHNPAGVRSLVDYLHRRGIERIDVGFAALSTKEWREMIRILKGISGDWFVMDANSSMSVGAADIKAYLSSIGISAKSYGDDYSKFVSDVLLHINPSDNPIVVVGSIYFISEVRKLLELPVFPVWKRADLTVEATPMLKEMMSASDDRQDV